MGLTLSRMLAYAAAVALPLAETWRRWHQLGDLSVWPFWLDDWLIAALLFLGAWQTGRNPERGKPLLAAAWGFAVAMGYSSFFYQLTHLEEAEPSGLASTAVVAVKGLALLIAVAALVATLASRPTQSGGESAGRAI